MNRKVFIALSILLFIFFSFNYANKVFSTSFVDEDDNFTSGKYILNGEKVYREFFSHHQPLAYILSAGIQKVTNPNSIYLLVKRHREFMIAWSLIWVLFLIFRFKTFFIPALIIVEILKIHLLGHLFLSENLVVYPTLYLVGLVLDSSAKLTPKELIFVGLVSGFIVFNLLPLWILVLFCFFSLIYKRASKLKIAVYILTGGLMCSLFLIAFIDFKGFFYQAILINYNYYIPISSEQPLILQAINAFLSPISLIFNDKQSATLLVSKILTTLLLLSSVVLARSGKIKLFVWFWFLISLANLRFIEPGKEFFSGFHLIPWMAVFTLVTFYSYSLSLPQIEDKLKNSYKLVTLFLVVSILITSVKFSQQLFAKRDIQTDFYVNYSQAVEIGEVVKILKNQNSKLFIAPAQSLIYWQADILHASHLLYYYAWMEEVPELKNSIHQLLGNNPPDLVFLERKGTYLETYLETYVEVKKHGTGRKLFVHPSLLKSLSQNQKDQLNFLEFKLY